MGKNNRNNSNRQPFTSQARTAAPEVLEVVEDEATKKSIPAVEPDVVEEVVVETPAPEVVEVPVASSVTTKDEDSASVVRLKKILTELKSALSRPGRSPEDYREAAKIAASLTKFVISQPKTDVLDALLAFFVEEKDGVAKADVFMKGSTTLNSTDEQQVGFLYTLFIDLAHRRVSRINSAMVVNILKKPEILSYCQRRVAGFRAK